MVDFYHKSLYQSISNKRGAWLISLLPCFIEIPVFNKKSVDPVQTPRSTASDLSLQRLSLFLLYLVLKGLKTGVHYKRRIKFHNVILSLDLQSTNRIPIYDISSPVTG